MADKRVKELIRQAERWPGWRVVETKNGYFLYPPDAAQSAVMVHKTPSDQRWYQNTKALVRQRGAPL